MTRRELLSFGPAAGVVPAGSRAQMTVPVHHVLDRRAKSRQQLIRNFWSSIWPEAVRDFGCCDLRLESRVGEGEVRRSPSGKPIFEGLDRGVINMVVTDQIPIEWDNGRGLSGVTTRWRGYQLCVIALNYAHAHMIPFLSVNTCVHELLHVLLLDIFENRPKGVAGQARELRIDMYATRLWLFRDCTGIREKAQAYVERLRSEPR